MSALETTQLNVNSNLSIINTNTQKSLRSFRKEEKCFNLHTFLISTSNKLLITNPATSTSTCYIYSININVYDNTANQEYFKITLNTTTNTTSSNSDSTVTVNNLKLDSTNTSNIKYEKNTGFTASNTLLAFSGITNGNTQLLDFQEEFIELPPNESLLFIHTGQTSSVQTRLDFKYIETDENI